MVGLAIASGVNPVVEAGGYTFTVARAEDESDIRALLRGNELGGWIRLAFEREPNAFAAAVLFDRHDFIVVRERCTARAIALCEYSVRRMYVNGAIVRVPYLGALRVERRFRHRIGVLRHGFAAVRELLRDPADFPAPLTSITSDNADAQRLLCAGLDALPRYAPIGEMVTLAATTQRSKPHRDIETASANDLPALAALLKQVDTPKSFAPGWEAKDLERLSQWGLPAKRFLIVRDGGRIIACVAVWDQRPWKQTVVRGYVGSVQRLRPAYNVLAPLIGSPQLPPSNCVLQQVFLSHFALLHEDAALRRHLLRAALAQAHTLGAQIALVGFAANHPALAPLRRLVHAREYRTQLHLVQWPDLSALPKIAGLVQPEIALL